MSKKPIFLLSTLALLALILAACNVANHRTPPPQPTVLSMANPASVFCEQQGGKVEMQRDAQGGEFGVCIFADGSRCEEWAFMRGECTPGAQPSPTPAGPAGDTPPSVTPETPLIGMANPASVYCEWMGGKLEMRNDDKGGQTGVCAFKDGSQCEEWTFFRGECQPASPQERKQVLGMPNPASVLCEQRGGHIEMRGDESKRSDSLVGMCVFDDGSECEEWALFRGECHAPGGPAAPGLANPASIFCEQNNGRLDIRRDEKSGSQVGANEYIGMCIFPDNSECEEWAYLRGECQPGGTPTPTPATGLANPASLFCEQQGGRLEIRTGQDGGQVGFCIFPDDSECEEWAYLRGECQPGKPGTLLTPAPLIPGIANPASLFCAQHGGTLEVRKDDQGGESGMCVFPDGARCDEWAFWRGECGPAGRPPVEAGLTLANPASLFCEQQGGVLEIRQDSQGGEYGLCTFKDGSLCEEWALFNGQCRPGSKPQTPGEYTNSAYGYTLKLPEGWSVEEKNAQQVLLRNEFYELFLGVQRPGEEPETFRSDTPTGERVDGGTFTLLGKPQPKQLLVVDGMTRRVEYASRLEAGPLLLTAWLEYRGAGDYALVDLPAAVIAQAEAILASFALK
jgi:uncharacterized protein